jgi:MYXO-CTERM domain-containing protein
MDRTYRAGRNEARSGELDFGLTESLTNLFGNSFIGNTFTPSPYAVTLAYGFIPPAPVPEPSLAPVAAALFGLIAWRRRQRRATTLTDK